MNSVRQPTLQGVRSTLSPAVASRWAELNGAIEKNDYDKPRYDTHPGLGEQPQGDGNRRSADPLHQPSGQCVDRPEGDMRLSWDQIAGDFISVGRAIWLASHKTPRWSVDVNYDIYRPVDFPGL